MQFAKLLWHLPQAALTFCVIDAVWSQNASDEQIETTKPLHAACTNATSAGSGNWFLKTHAPVAVKVAAPPETSDSPPMARKSAGQHSMNNVYEPATLVPRRTSISAARFVPFWHDG